MQGSGWDVKIGVWMQHENSSNLPIPIGRVLGVQTEEPEDHPRVVTTECVEGGVSRGNVGHVRGQRTDGTDGADVEPVPGPWSQHSSNYFPKEIGTA